MQGHRLSLGVQAGVDSASGGVGLGCGIRVWVEVRVGVGVETNKLRELAATRTLTPRSRPDLPLLGLEQRSRPLACLSRLAAQRLRLYLRLLTHTLQLRSAALQHRRRRLGARRRRRHLCLRSRLCPCRSCRRRLGRPRRLAHCCSTRGRRRYRRANRTRRTACTRSRSRDLKLGAKLIRLVRRNRRRPARLPRLLQ